MRGPSHTLIVCSVIDNVSFLFSERYSFVLTDVKGKRKFGYCRRIRVSSTTHCT